ncbi:hypothetical protein GCM10027519_21460 [Kineococcus endophyticus]
MNSSTGSSPALIAVLNRNRSATRSPTCAVRKAQEKGPDPPANAKGRSGL